MANHLSRGILKNFSNLFFSGNQGFLLLPGQLFDFPFPLQGCGMIRTALPVSQLQRQSAPGVFGALAGTVDRKAFFHIGGDAGVEGAVPAAENIKIPV